MLNDLRRRVFYLWESAGHLPGRCGAAVTVALGVVVGGLTFLLTTALWLGLMGLLILFIFASEPRQRQQFFQRLLVAWERASAACHRFRTLFASSPPK